MKTSVLGICAALGLLVLGMSVMYHGRQSPEVVLAEDFSETADQEVRKQQRAQTVEQVKRIVAEHPATATTTEDDPGLKEAREKRIEAMAEAVRRATATPPPEEKPPRE